MDPNNPNTLIVLPSPRMDGDMSVEQTLLQSRSKRHYQDTPLHLSEISQVLWAAQGITSPRGFRTAPSAGALYPIEIYIAAGNVDDLDPGIYKHLIHGHRLKKIVDGDKRALLSRAALGQRPVALAPVVLIVCAVYQRVTQKYGNRGIRYVHMESGHVAQNICLQAISLGLKTVVIGAFQDREVQRVAEAEADEIPLYLIPIGR